jgi:predicted NBD/HSP70 family sugar kinase
MGLGVGLPGPVNFTDGCVVAPARMPGWHGFGVRDWLAARLDLPVAVDNDANLVALGEFHTRNRGPEHLVVVKAGTGIGSGVIAAGVVHRGANGLSGDVSHVRVPAAGDSPCACGNTGCLETIASGAALVRSLGVSHTADLVELTNNADPRATAALRQAGEQLGAVLSTVVNFFNPHAVLLTGRLASIERFVAAVRGTLYERCLPMATQNLEVAVASTGADAGPLGAGMLALQQVHRRKD